jgi:predicted component of type VI protein secretion system
LPYLVPQITMKGIDAVEDWPENGTPAFPRSARLMGKRTSGIFMDAELIVVKGKASKARIALKLPTVIGRSRKADVTVAHPMVSRRHCEIFEADGLLMVRDLGSMNGTVVTGQRVKESPLPPDAELTVGPLTFRAQYAYSGDLSKLPAAVLADSDAAALPDTAEGELPELDLLEEPPAAAEKKETAETTKAPKAKGAEDPAELPDDLFEEFLKGE